MAIQSRRGNYPDFDPQKMLPGEWAVVRNGDPKTSDGRAAYLAFEPGIVKRMATYEDMKENVKEASADVIREVEEGLTAELQAAVQEANTATENANTAILNANAATADANNAATAAGNAAEESTRAANTAKEVTAGYKPDYYGAFDTFPRPGEDGKLYIDDTVIPRKIYTWDEEKQDFVTAGGAENVISGDDIEEIEEA